MSKKNTKPSQPIPKKKIRSGNPAIAAQAAAELEKEKELVAERKEIAERISTGEATKEDLRAMEPDKMPWTQKLCLLLAFLLGLGFGIYINRDGQGVWPIVTAITAGLFSTTVFIVVVNAVLSWRTQAFKRAISTGFIVLISFFVVFGMFSPQLFSPDSLNPVEYDPVTGEVIDSNQEYSQLNREDPLKLK